MTTLQPPSVLVDPGAHTASGAVAELAVHVRNLAPRTVDIHVSVIGLEPSWAPEAFAVPGVAADETVTVTIPLVPVPGATPGDYPFVVAVEAVVDGVAVRTLADAAVRVDGDSELVMSVEPVEARAVRSAAVAVVLVNASDSPAEVQLRAVGQDGIDVAVPDGALVVAARETVRVPARVRGPRVRLVGARRRHSYTVTATGRAAPQHVQAAISLRPLIGSGFARFVAGFAVIALWVGGVLTVLPYLADRFADRSTSVDTVTVEAGEEGGEAGEGDGPGGSGGPGGAGDPDSEGEEPDGEESGASEQVRAAGQITGASPSGVTVSVVPAASLWEAAEEDDDEPQALGEAAGSVLAALHPAGAGIAAVARLAAVARTPVGAGKVLATAFPLAPGDDSTQRMSVRSDEKGAWAIAGLSPSARYLVSVSKPGFQTQRVLRSGAELAAAPLETEMRAGTGQLSGTVSGPDGAVGGVEVTISDGETTVTTRTATTGTVGRWQVDGLATPGSYLVTAASDRLGAQSRLVSLVPSGVRTVDLRLRPGIASVSGRVIGTDALGGTGGIGGLTVTASNGTVSRSATTATGEDKRAGTFVLPDLPVPSTYTVTVSGTGYNTVTRQLRLGPAGRTDWDISVGIEGGTVTGAITSTDGAGITGVGLTLASETETFKTMSASGGKGTYLFSGIPAGTYVLSAQAFGYRSTFAQVEVRDGKESIANLELVAVPDDGLTSTGSITGRVVDASNGGVAECVELFGDEECLVHAKVDFKRLDGTPASIETWVDPEDPYVLPETDPATGSGLPPGRYTVQLAVPGFEPGSVQVTVGMGVAAEAATVALVPSPSLEGTVIPRVGTLPPGTCVVVSPVEGGVVQDPTGGAAEPCVTAVDECNTASSRCALVQGGLYSIDRLRSGTYSVRFANIDPAYRTPEPVQIALSPGDMRRYDVTIERFGIINLTVLKAEDAGSVTGADAVEVRATNTGGGAPVFVTTDNGFASFARLAPGTWELAVVDPGGGPPLAVTHVGIDLNQEVSAQLVITSGVASFTFYVGWQQADGASTPIEDAIVRVRGVTRYVGTVPHRDTVEFRTNNNGIATVCTVASACSAGELPIELVDRIVDITVEKSPGYQSVVWNAVAVPDVSEALLRPNGVPFSGQVTLLPAPAPGEVDPYAGISFEVEQSPPGTGQVSLSVDPATGAVVMSDSAGSGGNRIRPGQWRIRADRPGHTSHPAVFLVEPGAPSASATWPLQKYGRLVVHTLHGAEDVPEAQITLTQDGAELGTRTSDSEGEADFGAFVPGDYVLRVRAAGFAPMLNIPVTLAAGRLASETWDVQLTQLGSIAGTTRTRITSTWFQSLPGATVSAARDTGGTPATETFDATSAPDGEYRITGALQVPGLAPGTWRVTAEADGHQDAEYVSPTTTTNEVEIAAGEQRTGIGVDFDPLLSELTITVLDGEDRISGLDVVMRWREGNVSTPVFPCVAGDPDCAGVGPGEYRFTGLLPIAHNISISGMGYLSINVPHTVEIDSVDTLPIAMTAPGGSVQGNLYQRTASGGSTPLGGKVIELIAAAPEGPSFSFTTPVSGAFSISDVPAGEYTLQASEPGTPGDPEDPEDPGTPGAVLVSRTVQISSGQATVVDLFVDLALVSATVEVTSTNGTDLTGAQVSLDGVLAEGGSASYGPATLLRSSPGSNLFRASFGQLPLGEWTPTVTGPAGHFGSHVGSAVTVSSASSVIAMNVAEREVRLRATAPGSITVSVPTTLTVGSGASQFTIPRTLQAGASDTVLYVPTSSLGLAATSPTGWVASVSPSGTVAAGGAPVTFVVSLALSPSAVSLSLCSSGAVILTDFACSVQLTTPAGVSAGGRQVSVSVGSWSTTVTTGSTGAASFTVPATTVGTNNFSLGASWSGDGLTTNPVTATRNVNPSGNVNQLSVALCTGGATEGTEFDCSVTLAGPTGFSLASRPVLVEVVRGGTVVWSDDLTTNGSGTRNFTVPAATVGTTEFTLRASWTIDGLTTPRTAPPRTITPADPDPGP